MSNTKQFKCPTCGSALRFDIQTQNVKCDKCGNVYDIAALEKNAGQSDNNFSGNFDWGDYKRNLSDEKIDNSVVYQCQDCGALLETDGSTVSTSCPFCESSVVLEQRLSGGLKPNAVIPFKILKQDLPDYIKKFYKNKKLLPRGFFSGSVLGKAQGVYVPFWLFDAVIDADVKFSAEKVRNYRDGDYDCTETKYYSVRRAGSLSFSKVPVDASSKADNDLTDSVAPFDYSGLVPFQSAYLSGFVADRFDSSPDDELPRASYRMTNSTVSTFEATVTGYTSVSVSHTSANLLNPSVIYVLLPIYFLNCHYKDKIYRYAINGQTGKVVGELPISILRLLGYFLSTFILIAAVVFLVFYMILQFE